MREETAQHRPDSRRLGPGRLGQWGAGLLATLTAGSGGWLAVRGVRDGVAGGADIDPIVLSVAFWQPEPTTAPAPEGPVEAVVVMDDGTRYTGVLKPGPDDSTIVLDVSGIPLTLRRSEIARIDVLPPVLERYRQLRASIADDDIPALLTLVEWLVQRREYDAASEELLGIQRQEPRLPRALELGRLIEARRALESAQPAGRGDESGEDDPEVDVDPEDTDLRSKEPVPPLSPEEINLIRVYELDLDRLPRVIIKRETVERLLEEYAGDPLIPATAEGRDDLFRAARSNPRRVLEIIFRVRARHLYSEIQVQENPRAMQMFRAQVHRTWLINGCAACHTTRPDAPAGPRLITRRPNSDATVYSNFLILDRYRLPDGTPLINYDRPSASALLQLGLPRANSLWPHPDVASARGWSPVFMHESAAAFQKAVVWIGAMYRPRPDYPIDYPPVIAGQENGPTQPPVER